MTVHKTSGFFEYQVVGGENAILNEFPHMAVLGYPDFNGIIIYVLCGGSPITDLFVLTAAHCNEANRVALSMVRLGVISLKNQKRNQLT